MLHKNLINKNSLIFSSSPSAPIGETTLNHSLLGFYNFHTLIVSKKNKKSSLGTAAFY